MFGLGFPELIVICVIALLVFGPKKIPEAGKAIGQAIRGFKSSMEDGKEDRADRNAIPAKSCGTCGKTVDAEATFCSSCGQALKEKAV